MFFIVINNYSKWEKVIIVKGTKMYLKYLIQILLNKTKIM